uniref:NADH-ubiquinone oxidoreductase chain 5 n=1 Tax=Whitmania acranulata TaxID=1329092 RepID=X2C8S4_WHICA|nr:NADH dehydrogenase subunit 5 [Whitmania acranulata]AGL34621.1 NADH dehydrogenase subunit 5 [Whitmania acranulata]QIC20354.1 NADH dehydrogenase subunit 5 [Whitmania acranulata]
MPAASPCSMWIASSSSMKYSMMYRSMSRSKWNALITWQLKVREHIPTVAIGTLLWNTSEGCTSMPRRLSEMWESTVSEELIEQMSRPWVGLEQGMIWGEWVGDYMASLVWRSYDWLSWVSNHSYIMILVMYYLKSYLVWYSHQHSMWCMYDFMSMLLSVSWYLYMYDSYLYENKTQVMYSSAGYRKGPKFPFSSWLPAAMAAPTPVSALVHSSTLVTAGVFLLIRFYDFLYCFNYFNTVLLLVSIMTMVMSGLAASVEWDMKKIIALSTLSQLGLMMMTLSLNMLDLAYLHMVSHALFKALLFICAGNLIMNFFHSQDLRWMGNLSLQMPLTSLSILLSSMAMGGFPFLSSFYTKDQILELLIYNSWSVSVVVLMYVSIGITVFYSLRFCINLLWMVPMYCVLVSLNENKNVAVPMFIMGLMTVCMSCILLWIYPNFYTLVHIDKLVMLMPLFIIFVGFLFALLWSVMALDVEFPTQLMNNYMWFMVPLSTQVILGFMPNTKLCLELLDQSWLEYLGGYGMHEFLNWMYSYFIKFMNWELMWMLVKMVLFTCLMILVGLS